MLRRLERRVKNRADRSAYGDSVAVATTATIDRAGVEARTAADAIERAAKVGAAEQFATTIVDEHNVQLAARLGPVEVRRIRRDGLAGCGGSEQPKKTAGVGQSRDSFFDSHAGDMQFRQRYPQTRFPFFCEDHKTAGLSDSEI